MVTEKQASNKIIPIHLIKAHPDNYNFHPEEQVKQLEASYQTLGQFRSVVVWEQTDGSYIQLAGHGVLEAMRREDATEVRADVLPPTLDPIRAKSIMLADNLHAQNSQPDDEMLVRLLQEQQDAGYDLASLGSDEETLRQMLESLGDEMHSEEVIDGADRKLGTTPEEYLDQYQSTTLRQITLVYDQLEYSRIMRIFGAIRECEKLETNTDVVTFLLNNYAQSHIPEAVSC